jgi:cysteinyl-tRNA synthetase
MALSRIHELSRIALRSKAEGDQLKLAASMDLLGLLPSVVRSGTGSAAGKAEARAVGRGLNPAAIERAIEARLAARKAKNFAESDRIRDELLAQGIVLKDTPQGTTWEVKR